MGYAWGWSRVRVPFWAIKRSIVLEPSLNSFLTSYYHLCSICSPCLSKTPAFIAMLAAIPFLVLASLHQSWEFRGIPMNVLRRYVSCFLFVIQPLKPSRSWSMLKPLKTTRGIVQSGWETSTSMTWSGTSPWCRFDVWRPIDRLIFRTQMMPFIGDCCCEGLPISTRLRGLTMPQLVPSGIRQL